MEINKVRIQDIPEEERPRETHSKRAGISLKRRTAGNNPEDRVKGRECCQPMQPDILRIQYQAAQSCKCLKAYAGPWGWKGKGCSGSCGFRTCPQA